MTGPLFRSLNRQGQVQASPLCGIDVARVVKKLAVRAGDPAKYAGHSLRAGHATSAVIVGRRSGPSRSRQGIGACRWSGDTFGTDRCFGRIALGNGGFRWKKKS